MPFNSPLIDVIRDQILRDYRATLPEADTSTGSLINADASALSVAVWGLYKNQSWIVQNMLPDATSKDILERWARIYGIITVGKSSTQILTELTERLRNPAAGGNKADIERWAREANSNGILNLPLEEPSPATITNSGFNDFNEDNFTDGDELTTAFSTFGGGAGSSFKLDYGVGFAKDLVGSGFWKYVSESVFFKVEYSEDDATFVEVVSSYELIGLGYSFANWDSVGAKRIWRFTMTASTVLDISIGEVEFYEAGVEFVNSAVCYPNYGAIGTFHLVCSRNQERITNKLLDGIAEIIDFKIPISPHEYWVIRPSRKPITVIVNVIGDNLNTGIMETQTRNYIKSLAPGQTFIKGQVEVICYQNGATNVITIEPTANITAEEFEEIVEKSIKINQI